MGGVIWTGSGRLVRAVEMTAPRTFPTLAFGALLTQHPLAPAARLLLQRDVCRHSGRPRRSISPEPKLHFRRSQVRQEWCGRSGLCCKNAERPQAWNSRSIARVKQTGSYRKYLLGRLSLRIQRPGLLNCRFSDSMTKYCENEEGHGQDSQNRTDLHKNFTAPAYCENDPGCQSDYC